ncbi:MAG: hypothetical protein E6R03_04770 [Hyphomicrobiaceae bacterium]|nr:MAG: hypothetical protein E6R03_04770 [Hyphomicrobiaceae bacterium]
MTAAAISRVVNKRGSDVFPISRKLSVAAATLIHCNVLVGLNSTGYATNGIGTEPTMRIVGVSREEVDNSAGSAGDKKVLVEQGVFPFVNSSGADAITVLDIGKLCYVVDNQTVARTWGTSSTRPIAGRVHDINDDGTIDVQVGVASDDPSVVDILMPSNADYNTSSKQYYFVSVNSSGKAVLASAAGEACRGVLQNAPLADATAIVRVQGRSWVIASGSITSGADIATTSAGKSKTAVAGSVKTDDAGAANDALLGSNVMGFALEDGTTDTAHLCYIQPRGAVPTTVS